MNAKKENDSLNILPSPEKGHNFRFAAGILFTMIIALLGTAAAYLPVIDRIGAMLSSILIAVLYRNFFGYPERLREGIKFSGQRILRFAIVLFGFKLNIDIVLHKGAMLLVHDAISIILALTLTVLIGRLFKAEKMLSFLLGVGTGVCGAAAIAAVAPIVGSDDEETALGVGIIALMGTLFTLVYTFLMPYLPLTPTAYGIWSGISLHEIAHVVAAAAPAGPDALAIAILAKLGRVFLLIPLSFAISLWVRRSNKESGVKTAPFPWFLVGFLATSLIGTYLPIPKVVINDISNISSFLLAAAMVGLGLNVSLNHLRTRALRPLAAMFVASVILSIVSYYTLWF